MSTFRFVLFLGFVPLSAFALDGREIMQKHEEARKVPTFTAKAVLTSVKADGSQKEKSFTLWRKLKTDGIHFSLLTRFHAPSEIKNEAILFLENEKGENDILIFLPAYRKVRRIERAQQSASFMGSDFSYSDITTPHVADYTHTLVGDAACPSAPSEKCFLVEAKPLSDTIRERTGYSRTLSFVRKENFMVVENQNFDASGTLVKTTALTEIEKLPSGKWFTKKIRVTTKKDGGSTILQFSDVKEGKIEDSIFTQSSLAKGGRG